MRRFSVDLACDISELTLGSFQPRLGVTDSLSIFNARKRPLVNEFLYSIFQVAENESHANGGHCMEDIRDWTYCFSYRYYSVYGCTAR